MRDDGYLTAMGYGFPEWHTQAVCAQVGPDLFFGADEYRPIQPEQFKQAQIVCAGCPVFRDCLRSAIEGYEHGIWAGTSARERARIRALIIDTDITLEEVIETYADARTGDRGRIRADRGRRSLPATA